TQDNDQETQTQELLLRTLYMYHPCRHPVLGYQDLFLRLTAADVKNFYNTRYVPNNQIYVVTGCIDPGLVIQTLMNAYQNSGRGKDLAISLPIEPQQISPRESGQEQERETVRLVYAWPTVSRSHPDSFALDLLATILTGGADGILTQKTQWEKPLTTDISAQSLSFRFTNGFFKIEATTLPENLVALENVIQQTIDQLKTQPITEQRLARAKKILEMNFLFHSQDINEVMDRMVRNYLMTGDPNFDSEYLAKINKVSLGDVQQAFQKYLPGNTRNRVVILPIGMLPVQIASQPVSAEKPKHKVFNFNNGLRVIVYSADQSLNLLMNQDPGSLPADLPSIVNLQFTVLGNTLVDDDTNTGRAAVLAEMLGRETNSLKSKDIQQYFDSIGASLEFAVGRNTIYASMTLLQDDLDKSLDYLTECVTHPVFTEEELARAKKRVITRIRKRGDTPLGQLMEQFIQTVPRNSPYHLHQDGTVASVESLTLKDIQNYYNMLFVPQNTIITVAGDKNPAKTMARINQLFESVPKSGVFQPISFDRKNDLLEPLKTHKRVETETGLALVAFPAPAMTEIKDYAAMTVFQAILGNLGTSNGRLYDRLQRTGMVYRVGVEQTQGPVPGYFYILLETDPNQLRLVLEQLMQILHQIKTGDITEQEFLLARQQVIARQRMQNPTLQEQARRFTLLTLYRISPDFDSELIEIIQNMKPDDVLEAVHKYL
ncbi:MAG: insulinase family protein, partial [Thermoguttaceae bacterium]|nr:insulinase family protein [Thermoguttaceae bacterium]